MAKHEEVYAVIQTEPAHMWHDEQRLIVNEAGRLRLIEALQNQATEIEACCHDGEGYILEIVYGEDFVRPFYLVISDEERSARR